jgi:hypothetical protein
MSNTHKEFMSIKSKLARSLKETLTKEAVAPQEERPVDFDVTVPYHQLDIDEDSPGYAVATVIYVVRCPSEKRHVVHIKFQYDHTGRFLRNTMSYV